MSGATTCSSTTSAADHDRAPRRAGATGMTVARNPAATPPPPLRAGAVLHGPGSAAVDGLLDRFAAELRRRGFRIGGVVQRNEPAQTGCSQMVLVDVATGDRFNISQNLGRESQSCRVDPAGVAAASQAVRRGVEQRVDLLIVNKFAGLEANGGGLVQEMLAGLAEGIPVLTSVGGRYLAEWFAVTGGVTDPLVPTWGALWRWWGPHRLYQDLLLGIADAPVERVVIGERWLMVQADGAVGLAARPTGSRDRPAVDAEGLRSQGLRALASSGIHSWDPLAAAIGAAALNAHYNHRGVTGPAVNGLDVFGEIDGSVSVIGGFPSLRDHRRDTQVLELAPRPGEFPEAACDWLLPRSGAVLATASTLANRTLPRILAAARGRRLALVGPGTPLSPRLFDYGVEALCGFVAEDPDGVADTIVRGGSARTFQSFGRLVTLRRPEEV